LDAGGPKRATQDVRGILPPRRDMRDSAPAVPPVSQQPQPQAPVRLLRAEAPAPREREREREAAAPVRAPVPAPAPAPAAATGIDGSSWRSKFDFDVHKI
jgi:hypothetical protein